ncbi:MAG: hypothetical protein EA351_02745 [Gemmatimonadales bacterium]|nr:MAG: hypothetical protein EA351_02745 [Gemmatimonadales bacterium]
MPNITLLTDFGTRDGFIGAVKGVIQELYPGVGIDDIAHDLPRGDVAAGSRALGRYWKLWPVGTVHLAVVDPGVGSDRRPLVVEADRRLLVSPDNGILTAILSSAERWSAFECTNRDLQRVEPSRTFHGRDIFAPAAAYLARGVHAARFGPEVTDPVLLATSEPEISPDLLRGEVVSTDRFGNLITNLPWSAVPTEAEVDLDGTRIPLGSSYSDVPPMRPVALGNSDGCLEVAARDGSAEDLLGATVGTPIRVRRT